MNLGESFFVGALTAVRGERGGGEREKERKKERRREGEKERERGRVIGMRTEKRQRRNETNGFSDVSPFLLLLMKPRLETGQD